MFPPKIRNFFMSLPKASEDGHTITAVCPFCKGGHKSEAKFTVTMLSDKGPIIYNCYRASCGNSGILDTKTLTTMVNEMSGEVDMIDFSAYIELGELKKSSPNKILKKKYTSKDFKIFNIYNKMNIKKIEYLKNRLGLNFEIKDFRELKIQLSIKDFIRINNLKLNLPYDKIDKLEENYVGFVSAYNDYLILRKIDDSIKDGLDKYFNLRLSEKNLDAIKAYMVPMELHLLKPETTLFIIAEGFFSLIGFLKNSGVKIDEKAYANVIKISNNGFNYKNTILEICKQYGITEVVIYLISDGEIKIKNYQYLAKDLEKYLDIISFKVFYNTFRKDMDFGHTKDEIRSEYKTII